MALYVHITDTCQTEATRFGCDSQLRKARESIEKNQDIAGFDFLSPAVLKKKIGRPFRLIAWQHTTADDEFVFFLKLLQRRRNDYAELLENIKRNPRPYGDDRVRKICADLRSVSPAPSRPVPSDEERAWLDAPTLVDAFTDDPFIFETHSWVSSMKGNKLSPLYHKLLYDMADLDKLRESAGDTVAIRWAQEDGIGIAYHYRPDLNCLVLLEPLRGNYDKSLITHYASRLSDSDDSVALERMSLRSYPTLIALERDSWLTIQDDEESNLALSPEEAQIISPFRNSDRGTDTVKDLAYPLFINGLAGSGKSTILQYFAFTYLDYALRNDTRLLPLYLTASEDLLTRARESVTRLLTTNYTKVLDDPINPSALESMMGESFWTFRGFFQSILPSNLRDRFRSERYVNYASFRLLWESRFARRPEARQLSVEVAWHVIRSLIKGIRSHWEEELGPDDYEELPRRRRSVSSEMFNIVYEKVWRAWYRPICENEGYWDDQDLSAHVLGTGAARQQQRAAIFCDEAQDFTSADLDAVFQLSLYGGRTMFAHELRRVPFVFAGDPLQTINPTGFRWDAVKADFHERFRATIEAGRRSSIEISDRNLLFNYRSNAGIVRFCNLLQLARSALLGRSDIRPQEYWAPDDPMPAKWFALDDPATESYLRDHPELIKLVDCHEGEETKYVEEDEVLHRVVDRSEEGTYRNIMCPARVKGLEFSGVVLYRFGENMAHDFERLRAGLVDLEDPQTQLPWEYFFNRLYVAASRSRTRLIVVDSKETIKLFWRVATDPDIHDFLLNKIHDRSMWEGAFAPLLPGTPGDWAGEAVDQRAQADSFATQGLRERDPYLLRQAGLSYRSVDDDYKARRCFAQAAEVEEKWDTAAARYHELQLIEDAFRCYWHGQRWQSLQSLAVQQDYVHRIERRAADFMATDNIPSRPFLDQLCASASDECQLLKMSSDPTWTRVLGEVAERTARNGDYSVSYILDQSGIFDHLARVGVSIERSSLATIAFQAKNYQEAVRLWDETEQVLHKEYKVAKANITKFPDCLALFHDLGDSSEVLRRWTEARPSDSGIRALDPRITHTVIDAALDKNELLLARSLIDVHPERILVGKLLAAAVAEKNHGIVYDCAIVASRLFVRSRAWKDVVDVEGLASIARLAGIPVREFAKSMTHIGKRDGLLETVIRELARSDALVEGKPQLISSFLHRLFIGKNSVQISGAGRVSIPVEVIGAAIERAGKIVDALQYYEHVLEDEESTRGEKIFAAERLVLNLERHAQYLAKRGNVTQSQRQSSRAEGLRKKWEVEGPGLDDYPEVEKSENRVDTDGDTIGSVDYRSFWDSPSLDELARAQNVDPLSDVEDLFGTWPGEEDDRFEEQVDMLRHAQPE